MIYDIDLKYDDIREAQFYFIQTKRTSFKKDILLQAALDVLDQSIYPLPLLVFPTIEPGKENKFSEIAYYCLPESLSTGTTNLIEVPDLLMFTNKFYEVCLNNDLANLAYIESPEMLNNWLETTNFHLIMAYHNELNIKNNQIEKKDD